MSGEEKTPEKGVNAHDLEAIDPDATPALPPVSEGDKTPAGVRIRSEAELPSESKKEASPLSSPESAEPETVRGDEVNPESKVDTLRAVDAAIVAAAAAAGPESEPVTVRAAEGAAHGSDDGSKDSKPKTPIRWSWKGGIVAVVGILIAAFNMAKHGQWQAGVLLGMLAIAIASFGVLQLFGTMRAPTESEGASNGIDAKKLVAPIASLIVSALVFSGGLTGGHLIGNAPQILFGIIVTLGFIGIAGSLFLIRSAIVGNALDENGEERPLLRRHGFWLLIIGAGIYFPLLGSFSLWDPWETHYGEVAREMLARDDWVSLWWAQDGWFFSKPILNFWIQGVAMGLFRVRYQPDQMLSGWNGTLAHPEWIVRTPNVLLTLAALYFLYKGVAKVFGRRAALIGGIVLATMPDWYFLAHQTMADMPCIASMTAAMGLLLLGLNTDPEKRVRSYALSFRGTKFHLSVFHVIFVAVLMAALPQILYLVTRNVDFVAGGNDGTGFRAHWDSFSSGSGGGNCGLPGNEACKAFSAASVPRSLPATLTTVPQMLKRYFFAFEPSLQGLIWAGVIGALLFLNVHERRAQRLAYLGAWLFATLGWMGKGPAGFGLPIMCALVYVAATKRWSEFVRIEAASGLLMLLAIGMPWFVAMYVRHGSPFTDRLFFHDMWNRAFSHVHDTNEGDDTSFRFYIWQLGYALFPWTAIAPLGLAFWLRRSDSADKGRGDGSVFLVMWFAFAFTLFSWMGTKFHHYIFPAIPPIAMLIGIAISSMMARKNFLGTDSLVFARDVFTRMKPANAPALADGEVALSEHTATTADGKEPAPKLEELVKAQPYRDDAIESVTPPNDVTGETAEEGQARSAHEAVLFGAAGIAGALLLALIGRDLLTKVEGEQQGAIRFLQLFTYNYKRPWPEELDFSKPLWIFAGLGVVLLFGFIRRETRGPAAISFGVLGIVAALWGTDIYMVKTAPHWGQRELFEAYYRDRSSANDPIVAYQMNWKGENFYSSNKIPAFVSSGAPFTTWVREQREKGVHAIYFVTEPGRIGGLRNEAQAKEYRELTDRKVNNKFTLVKATL